MSDYTTRPQSQVISQTAPQTTSKSKVTDAYFVTNKDEDYGQYKVIPGIRLIYIDMFGNLVYSDSIYCFKDWSKYNEYLTLTNEISSAIQNKQTSDKKSIEKLQELNKEIERNYKDLKKPGTAHDGYRIKRFDRSGNSTNLTDSAKRIDIETLGVSSPNKTEMDVLQNAMRVQMATSTGETFVIQFQVDENGELKLNSLIPLTLKGATSPSIIPNPEHHLTGPENNTKIVDTFENLEEFIINGRDYKDAIAMHFKQEQLEKQEKIANIPAKSNSNKVQVNL